MIQLKNLGKVLQKQNITFETTERLLQYLKKEGFDLQFGARPLKRLIQKRVVDALSIAIIEGTIEPGMHIQMDVDDKGVVIFHT